MNTSTRMGGAAALAAACLVSACTYFERAPADPSVSSRPAADVDAARLTAAAAEPGNWMTHGGTYQEQRFSRLDRINQDNVGRLGLAWTYKLDLDRGVEATPIVVDGVMYTTGPFSMVYALDARSGELLWKYDPGVTRTRARDGCCGPVNRGVAVWKGKVYVGAYDGRLIALDAATGEPVWSVDTLIDKNRSYTVTGAPRVVKGKVIIGNGGAEFGVRGYITAYDADTGKQAWRFFTAIRPSRRKTRPWPGPGKPGSATSIGSRAAAARCGIPWPMTRGWTCSTSAPATAACGTARRAPKAKATTST